MYSFTHLLSIYYVPSSVLGIGDTKGNKSLFYFIPHKKDPNWRFLKSFQKSPTGNRRHINVNGSLEVFRVLSQSGSHRVIGLG